MTLDKVKKGDKITVLHVSDERARQQAMRLGIYEGAQFICTEKIYAGPVVLKGSHSETAIGKRMAEKIAIGFAPGDILEVE